MKPYIKGWPLFPRHRWSVAWLSPLGAKVVTWFPNWPDALDFANDRAVDSMVMEQAKEV